MGLKFNKKELASGGLMLFIGIATVVGSLNYDIKTLARMGPGYFPLILGATLVILGLLILATPSHEVDEDLRQEESSDTKKAAIRAWIAVVLGTILFIILGKYGGLVPATFVLVFVSARGDKANSIKASTILATTVTIFAIIVFNILLQMQFPLFTWG